jgi:hypothetical protein
LRKLDLGQTFTALANIGVIASIIFLAIELRQTNRSIQGATYQSRANVLTTRSDMLAESEYLTPIITKVQLEGLEALSVEEKNRLDNTTNGAFYRVDGMYYQYELGLLDRQYYSTIFDAEMRLWVPRWRDQGVLEQLRRRGYVRPSFDAEIKKYELILADTPLDPG